MFPVERKERMAPVMQQLAAIAGVRYVMQDDFDSAGVNVFLSLKGDKWKLDQPLRSIKSKMKKVFNKLDIDFDWLQQPAKRYSYGGQEYGKTINRDEGYDCLHIKIVVFV